MARRILAILLGAMALAQLSDVAGFLDVLATYELGGEATAVSLTILLIGAELVGAAGLLTAGRRRIGAIAGALVAVAWTALGTQAFARGLALENCGCFGVHLAQPLRWWVLLQDASFLALACAVTIGAWGVVLPRTGTSTASGTPAKRADAADASGEAPETVGTGG